jgi:hypothetical protein
LAGKLFVGCAGLLVLGVLFVGCLAVLGSGGGDETAGSGSGGGGNSGQDPEREPEEAESSGGAFTRENYPELISDPEAHEGAKVDITGRVFTTPEIVEGDTGFQIFADPKNGEWNTAVLTEKDDAIELEVDDYVHVVGTVAGSMEGANAFGGGVSAVLVEADKLSTISGAEAVDPAEKTVEVGRTLSDQGFGITLEKIEFGEDTTRAYVTVHNGTGTGASFNDYETTILQGSRQFDFEYTYDYEVKEPQSQLRPGVRTDGVLTFGKIEPSQPMEVRFEWYSDNYDVTTRPIVFRVEP